MGDTERLLDLMVTYAGAAADVAVARRTGLYLPEHLARCEAARVTLTNSLAALTAERDALAAEVKALRKGLERLATRAWEIIDNAQRCGGDNSFLVPGFPLLALEDALAAVEAAKVTP